MAKTRSSSGALRVVARWRWSSQVSSLRRRGFSSRQEICQLFARRHGRRAAVAGDHDGAAGVAEPQALLRRLLAQPTREKTAHKGVARAHGVEDLHGEARHPDAVLEVLRDLVGEDYSPHCADLEHDGRVGESADVSDRLVGVGGAASYPDLLLGPDQEVAVRKHGLVDPRNILAGDEHLAALLVGGHAPKHGPVVEVEDDLGPRLLRGLHRPKRGRPAPLTREGRARYEERLGGGDELGVHVTPFEG
jgi:hypothetical protein